MTTNIPYALKAADLGRFAQRAGQLEKAKPEIAYWCNYWIVNQIISKGLHQADADVMDYTTTLMGKLEKSKADFPENDAIADDLAGQAYVEQFGLETLQRAENAIKANRASIQTADTLQAAATFLDLGHIWGPLDPDIASKVKASKYHALRILKAIRAGEDPNLSNPKPESPISQGQTGLVPNDPDVWMQNGYDRPNSINSSNLHAAIEDVYDERDRTVPHVAPSSAFNEAVHRPNVPSLPQLPFPDPIDRPKTPSPVEMSGEDFYHTTAPVDVSPLAPTAVGRKASEGGGYFPTSTAPEDKVPALELPGAPADDPGSPPKMAPDNHSFQQAAQPQPGSLHSFPPPHMDGPSRPPGPQSHISQNPQPPTFRPPVIYPPPQNTESRSTRPPAVKNMKAPIPFASNEVSFVADEEAILKAQKHARWAISALNFEDVNTAVKELKGALESLGAR